MKTTNTRISSFGLRGLDYLCGLTGDNRRDTIDRLVAFGIKEKEAYSDRKKYEAVLKMFGDRTLRLVTK